MLARRESGGAPAAALEIDPGQVAGLFRFDELFGRSGPVEIEIGIGKGRFVLKEATERPDVNFLALEWSLRRLRVAKDRAAKRGLTNVRFHRADARHVVTELVPEASVSRLHVYCPDPWPKKRHHKRRFFSREMVPHVERILAPGGFLHVSTDFLEYFEEIRAVLGEHTGLLEATDPLFPCLPSEGRTNYELKYLAAGRVIHRATYVRPAVG